MKIGPFFLPPVQPWNRYNCIPRILVIILFIAWAIWGVILFREGRAIDAKIKARQQELQRKEERLRRQAAYEQSRIQEQLNKGSSRNAIDGVKR